MKLNTAQFKTLSKYSSDISKAIVIAVILGQGIIDDASFDIKIRLSFYLFSLSIFLLILSIMIDGRIKR